MVVLDWMMPGETGISLARALREDRRTKELPIIMLTARAAEADPLELRSRGTIQSAFALFRPNRQ